MNSVIKILEEYLELEKLKKKINYDKLTWEEKDDFRLQNEKDANYYCNCGLKKEDALKADTIVSFWTPYCRLLKLEAEWDIYNNAKTIGTLEALLKQINATWENTYSTKIKAVNSKIEAFAEVCYTEGNYMLLPQRQMNKQRYRFTEDRIDLTIYESFDKGLLSKFFKLNDRLCSWINDENLQEVCFDNGIAKENIKWLVNEENPKLISEMKADEIYEYLNNAVKLIKMRNQIINRN